MTTHDKIALSKRLTWLCMNEFVSRLSYDTISATGYFTPNEEFAMEEAKVYFMLEDLDFILFLEGLNDKAVEKIAIDLGVGDTISRENIENKISELGLIKLLKEFDDDTLQNLYRKFDVKCEEGLTKLALKVIAD